MGGTSIISPLYTGSAEFGANRTKTVFSVPGIHRPEIFFLVPSGWDRKRLSPGATPNTQRKQEGYDLGSGYCQEALPPALALTKLCGAGAGGMGRKARSLHVIGDLPADRVSSFKVSTA